jgi:hypothetical protein
MKSEGHIPLLANAQNVIQKPDILGKSIIIKKMKKLNVRAAKNIIYLKEIKIYIKMGYILLMKLKENLLILVWEKLMKII